jgi:hypothetical protein
MPRCLPLTVLLALTLMASALPVRAQSDDDRYTIMRPEPWLPPKYQSPRGTRQHVVPIRPGRAARPPVATTPPSLYVPQTGQVLPNLPTVSPSGPRGTETYQDRAARCAHQAGVYGAMAGDRNAYIGSCINQ